MFVQFRESQERKKNVWDFCLRAESGYAHFIKFYNSTIKLGLVRTRDTSTFVRFHSNFGNRENEAENWNWKWNGDYCFFSIRSDALCFYHLFSCFWTCKHFFQFLVCLIFSLSRISTVWKTRQIRANAQKKTSISISRLLSHQESIQDLRLTWHLSKVSFWISKQGLFLDNWDSLATELKLICDKESHNAMLISLGNVTIII